MSSPAENDTLATGAPAASPRSAQWRELARTVVIALVVALGVRNAIAQPYEVDGPSMEPTLFEGERLFVMRCAYGLSVPFVKEALAVWAIPEPGTVVIVESPEDDVDLVKRVIGVPGDVIEVRDDVVYRNGEPILQRVIGPCAPDRQLLRTNECEIVEESHGGRRWQISRSELDGASSHPPVVVPARHVYVLGDHRDTSNDSRLFGPVPIDQVRGRVLFVD